MHRVLHIARVGYESILTALDVLFAMALKMFWCLWCEKIGYWNTFSIKKRVGLHLSLPYCNWLTFKAKNEFHNILSYKDHKVEHVKRTNHKFFYLLCNLPKILDMLCWQHDYIWLLDSCVISCCSLCCQRVLGGEDSETEGTSFKECICQRNTSTQSTRILSVPSIYSICCATARTSSIVHPAKLRH